MKSCNGCPINITSEEGEQNNNYGCLADFNQAMKWHEDTGKVWACHEKPTTPCKGLLILAKEKGNPIKITKNTVLITESMTIEEIYEKTTNPPEAEEEAKKNRTRSLG